jgi:fumarate reductase subunit D
MKPRGEPFVWLMFSAGGVMAAVFLPSLAFLFGLAIPLGWVDRPDHTHLLHVLATPLTFVALLGMFVLMLVHSAHRFRFTLYDGLQIKFRRTVAGLCYGSAILVSVLAFVVLRSVA